MSTFHDTNPYVDDSQPILNVTFSTGYGFSCLFYITAAVTQGSAGHIRMCLWYTAPAQLFAELAMLDDIAGMEFPDSNTSQICMR
jgi:hypothetical protein